MKTNLAALLWVSCCFVACGPGGGGGGTGGGTGSTCTAPTGPGTEHSSAPTSDETWSAADSPHIITTSLNIYNDVTVTVEPCAVVELGENVVLAFGDSVEGAHLVARGTESAPIVFKPRIAGTHWSSLVFSKYATGDLSWVSLESGAAVSNALNYRATLMLRGDDNQQQPQQLVRVDHVRINNAENQGVEVSAAGGFTADSRDLSVTYSGSYPVRGEPLAIQTVPTGGSFEGNAAAEMRVAIRGSVQGDLHLKNYGLPFVLEYSMQLVAPTSSTITWRIDPGVTIRIPRDQGIQLANTSSINGGAVRVLANGTDTQPIRFTSASAAPAPGDWSVIDWETGTFDSSLNHVIFEYGGGFNGHNGFGCGNSNNRGLLLIHNWVPPEGLVQNSTFRNSGGGGIVSGWSVPSQLPNLAVNNTFEAMHVEHCAVSMPEGTVECSATDAPGACYL